MERMERFRHIRLRLGHSYRSMSAAIAGSPGLWAQYETGRRFPSYEVLERLSVLGVNIDWLIAGRGSMFVGDPPPAPVNPGEGFARILNTLELVLREQDADNFKLWSAIVSVLSRSTDGMSVDGLAKQLQMLPSDPALLDQLEWLHQQGVIGYAKSVYRLIRSSYSLDASNAELQGLLAVKDLISQIIPALKDGVGRGKLMRIAETPASGLILERLSELGKQIRVLDSESIAKTGPARSKTFQLVYAYLVTE